MRPANSEIIVPPTWADLSRRLESVGIGATLRAAGSPSTNWTADLVSLNTGDRLRDGVGEAESVDALIEQLLQTSVDNIF